MYLIYFVFRIYWQLFLQISLKLHNQTNTSTFLIHGTLAKYVNKEIFKAKTSMENWGGKTKKKWRNHLSSFFFNLNGFFYLSLLPIKVKTNLRNANSIRNLVLIRIWLFFDEYLVILMLCIRFFSWKSFYNPLDSLTTSR